MGGLNKTLKYTFAVHIVTVNDEHKDSHHESQSQHNLSDKLTDANPKILNPIHYAGFVCVSCVCVSVCGKASVQCRVTKPGYAASPDIFAHGNQLNLLIFNLSIPPLFLLKFSF